MTNNNDRNDDRLNNDVDDDNVEESSIFSEFMDEEEIAAKAKKQEIAEEVAEFLSKEGYRPRVDKDDNVVVKHEGTTFITTISPEPQTPDVFYHILAIYEDDSDETALKRRIISLEKLNMSVKSIKAHSISEDSIVLGVEAYYDNVEDFTKRISRFFSLIVGSRQYYLGTVAKLEKLEAEADQNDDEESWKSGSFDPSFNLSGNDDEAESWKNGSFEPSFNLSANDDEEDEDDEDDEDDDDFWKIGSPESPFDDEEELLAPEDYDDDEEDEDDDEELSAPLDLTPDKKAFLDILTQVTTENLDRMSSLHDNDEDNFDLSDEALEQQTQVYNEVAKQMECLNAELRKRFGLDDANKNAGETAPQVQKSDDETDASDESK